MADKRYRSAALKRKLKDERQRREKEALSKLKTITGFFTPVTPQPDVPVLAERSVDNNLLEETAGADLWIIVFSVRSHGGGNRNSDCTR